jgi:hypothetical protein
MTYPRPGDVWVNAQGGGALIDKVVARPHEVTTVWWVRVNRKGVLGRGSGIYGFNEFCDAYRYGYTATDAQIASWERVMKQAWPYLRITTEQKETK